MLSSYRLLSLLLLPALLVWYGLRLRQGKEIAGRWRERFGLDQTPRPTGPLLWVHAASVGESLAVLPLIERLLARQPEAHLLVTTGTVTSAAIITPRLPERALHRFIPFDSLPLVRAFLRHWRPDLGLLVESELWPGLLSEARRLQLPMAIVNGRLSERSFRFWQRLPGLAAGMMRCLRTVLAQGEGDAARFRALGAEDSRYLGNLKYDAPPLPVEETHLAELTRQIGSRPLWVAASTHPGEERLIADAHRAIAEAYPELLTIIIPRHAQRGEALAAELAATGLTVARRSQGQSPAGQTLYLADSMGELGLFYRLAEIVFMGGSLVPHGGQNPLEAARLGSAVLSGPHLHNFPDIARELQDAGALTVTPDVPSLARAVTALLSQPAERAAQIHRTTTAVAARAGVLARMLEALTPLLPISSSSSQPQAAA